MAILGPSQLPVILKVDSNPLKLHAISELGHPNVLIEMQEPQWEQILRSMGDFVAHHFPYEERYAFFYTNPLQHTYDLPQDAYWVREVAWDPVTSRIDDIFSAESFLFNIGNVTGIQNLLTDYHLLQAYRKFSQRILGTEGRWEFSYGENKIRLFPTPKGNFPVIVRYSPSVTEFKNPHARELAFRAILAKTKIAVGNVRRKIGNMPAPDGGTIGLDGDALVAEGKAEYDKLEQDLLLYGEPMGIFVK